MGNAEEYGLPKHEPMKTEWENWPMNINKPYPLYSTAALAKDSLDKLLEALRPQMDGEIWEDNGYLVALAAQGAGFAGPTLRDVYDAHIDFVKSSSEKEQWEFFVVNTHEDWATHGVLVVTLCTSDDLDEVDVLRMPVGDVGVALLNLQIANTEWGEVVDGVFGASDEE